MLADDTADVDANREDVFRRARVLLRDDLAFGVGQTDQAQHRQSHRDPEV